MPGTDYSAANVWRKSSFSLADCVAMAELADGIGVKSTNRLESGSLCLTREQIAAWMDDIKSGRLDHLA